MTSVQQDPAAPKPNVPGAVPEWVKPGAVVDYCSVIGRHVTEPGMIVRGAPFQSSAGYWVVFLEGKSGYVVVEALRRAGVLSEVRAEMRRPSFDPPVPQPYAQFQPELEEYVSQLHEQVDSADGMFGMAEDDPLYPPEGGNKAFRSRLLIIAALAVAAVERMDAVGGADR